jgi:hypothetical protein
VSLRELAAFTFVSKGARALCNEFIIHHLTLARLRELVERLPAKGFFCAHKMMKKRGENIFSSPTSSLCYDPSRGVFELRTGFLGLATYSVTSVIAWRYERCFRIDELHMYPSLEKAVRVAIAKIELEEEEGQEPVLKKRRSE